MIIKKRDSKEADIKELTSLLSLPLPENKKFLVERELRTMKAGNKGEQDSAYFIDFHFASSENWAVIHDLRLVHKDRVAQIDHVLINRFFDIYLLETKNFSYGVKITETGEFLANYNNKYFAIESPIEQNERHRIVLEKVIEQYDVMPKRLGLKIIPTFRPYVMVAPKSRVIRPSKEKFETGMVIKADTLRTAIDKETDNLGALSVLTTASKLSSFETVVEVTKRLASLHKPSKMDYRKRFGIEDAARPQPAAMPQAATRKEAVETPKTKICPDCGAPMVVRVAKKGAHANEPFWGCTNYPKCKAIVAMTAKNKNSQHALIPPHGGYRKLRSYQTAELVYDATIVFCDRFIERRSRTHDQMVQAARSGVQNIAEGSMASATSKKTELKLTGVARASLEELLLDYEAFLRQRGLRIWTKDSPEALAVRKKYQSDKSDRKSDRSDLSDTFDPYSLRTASPEVAANTLICLINQAGYLLGRQLQRLEHQFLEEGGFTERLYKARTQARRK